MRANVAKCHFLAIKASSGMAYDPKLVLQGASIPYIGNSPIKFLGVYIQVPPDQHWARDQLQTKLLTLMEKVDVTPVTRSQKLLLYRAAICPRLLWDLGVSDQPISWVNKSLKATATRFLKKWSGLARVADPSRLYLPKKKAGMALPNIFTMYKKIKSSIACNLLVSRDPITQQVTKLQVQREETQQRAVFHPTLKAREVILWQMTLEQSGKSS